MSLWWLIGFCGVIVFSFLIYWLFVITEGVFLGRACVKFLYNLTAYRYDDIKEYTLEYERDLVVEPLLAGVRTSQPKLLDVATGTGRVPVYLLLDGRFDGEIIGLDSAEKMLDHARANLAPITGGDNVHLMHHESTPLPFGDAEFDAVSCLEALEFMPDHKAALREIERVLKPGGFLMTTRRREWEAYFFLHRYESRKGFIALLTEIGFTQARWFHWQDTYDLVLAYKPLKKGNKT